MSYGSGNSGDYKKLKGQMIQVVDTDPVVYAGSWATGANINTARKGLSGFGTSPAAIAATGNDPSTVTSCESWNGSAWSEVADVNTGKFYRGNCGTQTAGLIVGGAPATTDTEEWDGSSWTETADYPASVTFPILLGIQTAAFCIAGTVGPDYVTATNTYNGSAFTSSTAINTARGEGVGAGTTTAGVITGGNTGSVSNATEKWDGSSWTEVGDLNSARNLLAGSGASSTAMLAFGGNATAVVSTESWNGTTWTEVGDLSTGRRELGGSTNGTSQLGLAFSGCIANGTVQSATEEWSFPSAPGVQEGQLWIKTATGTSSVMKGYQAQGTGAWASGGNLPQALFENAGAGATQSAALNFGGQGNPPGPAHPVSGETQTYNGSSWTEVADLNNARKLLAGSGTQTSALAYGGEGPHSAETEVWDGSSWTSVAELNSGRLYIKGIGTSSTSAVLAGGKIGPPAPTVTNVETWDGSSWTETTELNSGRERHGATGSSTAGIVTGGYNGPGDSALSICETWNGSGWTETGDLNTARFQLSSSGDSSSALAIGGTPGHKAVTEEFNGSSWTEVGDLSLARNAHATSGHTSFEAMTFGGSSPPDNRTATTEEWNVPFVTKTIGTD